MIYKLSFQEQSWKRSRISTSTRWMRGHSCHIRRVWKPGKVTLSIFISLDKQKRQSFLNGTDAATIHNQHPASWKARLYMLEILTCFWIPCRVKRISHSAFLIAFSTSPSTEMMQNPDYYFGRPVRCKACKVSLWSGGQRFCVYHHHWSQR